MYFKLNIIRRQLANVISIYQLKLGKDFTIDEKSENHVNTMSPCSAYKMTKKAQKRQWNIVKRTINFSCVCMWVSFVLTHYLPEDAAIMYNWQLKICQLLLQCYSTCTHSSTKAQDTSKDICLRSVWVLVQMTFALRHFGEIWVICESENECQKRETYSLNGVAIVCQMLISVET